MNLQRILDEYKYSHILLLIIACYISFFLFNSEFYVNIMESRNFVTAREMIEKGNWLVPSMNGELRLAKPPFPTWVTALFGMWFGMENLSMLRFPAGIMGSIMVLFMYRFTLKMNGNRDKALINSLILTSSFYVLYMSRTGTWDIFCHSFMLGAICLLYQAWTSEKESWKTFTGAGILLGLSFLSKGPVSFFAMLVPFIIAFVWVYDGKIILKRWKPFVLAILIFAVISFWWPLYIAIAHAQEAAAVAQLESGSWMNRHVRPFYYYWNFPIQSGIWTLAIFSSLVVPYALKNFEAKKEYKLILIWTLSAVVLLSLIPEKKDRYLLPVLIPSAILAGNLFYHLKQVFEKNTAKKFDRILFAANVWIVALVACALPIAIFIAFVQKGFMEMPNFILFSLLSELLFLALIWVYRTKNVRGFVLSTAAFMFLAIVFIIPKTDGLLNQNKEFKSIAEVKNHPEITKYNYYRIGDSEFRIELVYEIGKEVRAWDLKKDPQFPETGAFVVISTENPNELFSEAQKQKMRLQIIDQYDNNTHSVGKRRYKPQFKKYVSVVTPIVTNK